MSDPRNLAANDEISLIDIFRVLKRYKWLLLAAPLFASSVALIMVRQMPSVWEGSALVLIGQVGQIGQNIEPPARAVERMTNPSFMHEVADSGNFGTEDKSSVFLLYEESFKAKQLPNTDLIELKVRGYSREGVQALLMANVSGLRQIHDELIKPSVQNSKKNLALADRAINDVKNTMDWMQKRMMSGRVNSTEAVPYAMLLQQKSSELQALEQRKISIEEQLSPARTYPTSLVGKIYTSNKPVSPKKGLIIAMAALLGLLVAILLAFLHYSYGRAYQK